MCNRKTWSDEEVTTLVEYISTLGRAEGLARFSEETGRSVDSVRRKLLRVNDAEAKLFEEEVNDADFEEVTDARFTTDVNETPSLLRRIYNFIFLR